MANFNINHYLTMFVSDPASIGSSYLPLNSHLDAIETRLDDCIEVLSSDPHTIQKNDLFDTMRGFCGAYDGLSRRLQIKLLNLAISSLSLEADLFAQAIEVMSSQQLESHRLTVEILSFVLMWVLHSAEGIGFDKQTATGRGKSKVSRNKQEEQDKKTYDKHEMASLFSSAFDAMCKILKLRLAKVWTTTSEHDALVSLFIKPAYLFAENEEYIKNASLRMRIFKVICMAVKHHGHELGAQTTMVQALQYYDHLSDHWAELLKILHDQYDFSQLTDDILRDLSCKEFDNSDAKGPKSVGQFLVKLSEILPRAVLKQMTLLVKHLDSESYTIRNGLIECCGNIIIELVKDADEEGVKSQAESYFEILEERVLDINPYCRSKVFQVYARIFNSNVKLPQYRQIATKLAVQALADRSSFVRRSALKLLSKLVSTHPFGHLHGPALDLSIWNERFTAVESNIKAIESPSRASRPSNNEHDDDSFCNDKENHPTSAPKDRVNGADSDDMLKFQLVQRYYTEAIEFIRALHEGSECINQLLASKAKSEAIEAMDFLVIADAYHLQTAKGNNDDSGAVVTHLMNCYKSLYLEAPDELNEAGHGLYVARSLISLTYGSTLAELTSLEQLMHLLMKSNYIETQVIDSLWRIYAGSGKESHKNSRLGAVMILGMLALAEPRIIRDNVESLLRIGLGTCGHEDLNLAKYTCIGLQRFMPTTGTDKLAKSASLLLPSDHIILSHLENLIKVTTNRKIWYGVAEQAINAIYVLAKNPDVLCGKIIKDAVNWLFQAKDKLPASRSWKLCQLVFLLGHIAIKQIVYIENCENEFKQHKAQIEKASLADGKVRKSAADSNELDLIAGTSEDDFVDALVTIRERELLYGEKSLLRRFGPILAEICSRNDIYRDPDLQAASTLALSKFMCVSSKFCDDHLPLFLSILEKSTSSIVRSNAVIALGDMTVCFNQLIDDKTEYMYRRLRDEDTSVKKTCLMTLTFLILAGQVKVKGQLGEMAKCLEDSDRRIADLAKMFFSELSTKDNAIYNGFIDIFSLLSASPDPMEETKFKKIIKFLISFVEKDKHAKQLAEKLAIRLSRTESERQWNDIAYSLTLLPHKNEEIQRVVEAGFKIVASTA